MSAHGVEAIVGIDCCTDSPSDFSMYFSSATSIVGWLRGFSNTSHRYAAYLIELIRFRSKVKQWIPIPCSIQQHATIPNNSDRTIEIERRLPAERGQQAGHGQPNHHACVWSTESDCGQSGPFQRRRPKSPNSVAGRIGDALWKKIYYITHYWYMFKKKVITCLFLQIYSIVNFI